MFSVLNTYYTLVMYSLYKEMQEYGYEGIPDDFQPALREEATSDNVQPASVKNNTLNLTIDKCIVITAPVNRSDYYQNI